MVTILTKIVFPILMFTMLKWGFFERQPKFGCHWLSYKRVTELIKQNKTGYTFIFDSEIYNSGKSIGEQYSAESPLL